jgi:hypothetical protein
MINSTIGRWRPAKGCGKKKHTGWVNVNHASVLAQGHIHWLGKRKLAPRSEETFVFSFFLDDETSRTISLPTLDKLEENQFDHTLTELSGSLCLVCAEVNNFLWSARRYDVWLLRGHDTCIWDLHYRIDVDMLPPMVANFMRARDLISLVGIADDGPRIILLRECFTSVLCSYNPVTNDMEKLMDSRDLVSNTNMQLSHVALYEESIASPGEPLTIL